MKLEHYFPVLVQIILDGGIAAVILFFSWLLGQKSRRGPIRDTPYECGMVAIGKTHPKVSVKFYLIAMLFILFDIEIVFLLPWCLVVREFIHNHLPIVLPGLFFTGLLTLGLVYEWKRGALEWE